MAPLRPASLKDVAKGTGPTVASASVQRPHGLQPDSHTTAKTTNEDNARANKNDDPRGPRTAHNIKHHNGYATMSSTILARTKEANADLDQKWLRWRIAGMLNSNL